MTLSEQFWYLVKGMPHWYLWRLDAWIIRMSDLQELSPDVFDAFYRNAR